MSWPVVSAAFTAHAAGALPDQPETVEVLGIDEIRRGRPKWVLDEATGTWQTTVDRWHVGFCDLSGGQGLLGQVEGRTAQVVIDWLHGRAEQWRDAVRYVAIDMCTIFKSAVRQVLPHAQLVVDHFHLVQGRSSTCSSRPAVLDELIPQAWHHVEQYANNPIEADHSQLKQRLRPMRGLRTDKTAQVIVAGHAFMQNLRRGHYELAVDAPPATRVAAAFTELAQAI
ncbi:transposase [Micromonospora sp. NPDC005173]|uniref:transposase n=1 Tax=Micromonospora sp. NPDC005173 TaxID=3157165 RepID=UPI0033A42A17